MNIQPYNRLMESFNDLDLVLKLLAVCDLVFFGSEDHASQSTVPQFSKKYFTLYYDVDLATFNKWIEVFCPEIFADDYKKKRKFSEAQALNIFDQLGVYKLKDRVPRNHKELADLIFKDYPWEKSKRYRELQLDLSEKLNGIKMNVLPPKIVYEILSEELENFADTLKGRDERKHIERFTALESVVRKYRVLSEWEIQVKIRAFRIWIHSINENDDKE